MQHFLSNVVESLAKTQIDKIGVSELEDYMFRLNILSFTAELDMLRNPDDKPLFDGLAAFTKGISDAITFIASLAKPEGKPVLERTTYKHFDDISFQGNILLFYTRDEISQARLGCFLSEKQKDAFGKICNMIDSFIHFTQNTVDETEYGDIYDRLCKLNPQPPKGGRFGYAAKAA